MRIPACCACRLALCLIALSLLCRTGATATSARSASSRFRAYLPLLARAAVPSIEQQVIDLTNEQRRQHGCTVKLVISPQLAAAASAHSRDMALNNLFSHIG